MLTTDQILNAMFTPVSKGAYNAEEVDSFLKNVAESYEAALQNNKELIKKISILADKIESYRNDEEAIKLALLDARRLAETISKEADEKAKAKLDDADLKAKVVLDGANRQSTEMINEAREKAKEIVDGARVAVTSLTDRAQRETEQAIVAAQQKATEIVLKAEAQGKEIIGSSKADYEYYSCELDRIKAETAEFKATIENLCKGQLELIGGAAFVPMTLEEKSETFAVEVEDTAEESVAQTVVADAVVEEKSDDAAVDVSDDSAAVVDEAADDAETVSDDVDEVVLEVPDFDDEDASDDSAVIEEDDASDNDEDDIFSIIEELNFDDIVSPDSIAATLDEAVAEAEKAKNADADVDDSSDDSDEVIDDDVIAVDDDEDDEDDDFSGFKIDLDEITSDDTDDEEITSLFDSFFSDDEED